MGDVILPGLLVVMVLRFDYARAQFAASVAGTGAGAATSTVAASSSASPPSVSWRAWMRAHTYWLSTCAAYAFGLGLTFTANVRGWTINGVRGQPALLYLAPLTLLAVLGLSLARRETGVLWRGDWLAWEQLHQTHGKRRRRRPPPPPIDAVDVSDVASSSARVVAQQPQQHLHHQAPSS